MSYSYRSSRTSSVSHKFARNKSGQRRTQRGPKGSYIDPTRFVKSATVTDIEVYLPQHEFADFALNDMLQKNLSAKGYVIPSPIQDQAIPLGLEGRDIIGVAGTGTGKTAAFALPILQKLIDDKSSSALIVAPTRELAQQIEVECRALGQGSGLSGAVLIGGTSMGPQLGDLRARPRIVIGTPGRIKDHIERRTLNLANFNIVVLDEVDRMLDMGFVHDVRSILQEMKTERQSFFFSATIDNNIRTLIDTFTKDPVSIAIKASAASENVDQNVIRYIGNHDKLDKLHDLLLQDAVAKVIVFDETQRGVERLNRELVERGFDAESIHGGKSQGQRQRALSKFKKSEVNILVATDVAARGIDVVDITHVINYSIPKEYQDYIHRIGRAGRAGRQGYALTFVTNN